MQAVQASQQSDMIWVSRVIFSNHGPPHFNDHGPGVLVPVFPLAELIFLVLLFFSI